MTEPAFKRTKLLNIEIEVAENGYIVEAWYETNKPGGLYGTQERVRHICRDTWDVRERIQLMLYEHEALKAAAAGEEPEAIPF